MSKKSRIHYIYCHFIIILSMPWIYFQLTIRKNPSWTRTLNFKFYVVSRDKRYISWKLTLKTIETYCTLSNETNLNIEYTSTMRNTNCSQIFTPHHPLNTHTPARVGTDCWVRYALPILSRQGPETVDIVYLLIASCISTNISQDLPNCESLKGISWADDHDDVCLSIIGRVMTCEH
jgi:hypothetical protein